MVAPVLSSIAPSSAPAGAPVNLVATGTDFSADCVLKIDGAAHASTFVDATSITATLTAAEATEGAKAITIENADGASNPQTLTIAAAAPAAAPALHSLEPNHAEIGGDDLTLRCLGENFTAESVIVFNNGDETTTFVSASEVTTGVKPSTASGARQVPIYVRNADGQQTRALFFSFNHPAVPANSLGNFVPPNPGNGDYGITNPADAWGEDLGDVILSVVNIGPNAVIQIGYAPAAPEEIWMRGKLSTSPDWGAWSKLDPAALSTTTP